MNRRQRLAARVLAGSLALAALHANAQSGIKITEWMYNGLGQTGEFIELSNFGPTAIDFTGWSFDDDSRTPGVFSLSGFGLVQPGESVVISEAASALFRTDWNLATSVRVLGGNTANLGRNDEINIFDGTSALVDRLTYGDVPYPGSPRTVDISGRPGSAGVIGTNSVTGWVFSTVGDVDGAFTATTGNVGSPGFSSFAIAAVPEPETWGLMLAGLVALGYVGRRRLRD